MNKLYQQLDQIETLIKHADKVKAKALAKRLEKMSGWYNLNPEQRIVILQLKKQADKIA